jgi:hypothetical protein
MILLLICFLHPFVYSQDDQIDSLLNDVLFGDDEDLMDMLITSKKFQFLYSRLNYDTKTYFAGRDTGFDQFNMTGQLAYFHSSGLSIGAAAIYYRDLVPKISAALVTVGYNELFAKSRDYRFRISYDRYFFTKSDSLSTSSFNSSANVGFTIDKKIVGTRFDYALLIGKEVGSQLSWDLYGDFVVLKLGKFDHIKFEPEVSFYVGSDKTTITQLGIVPGRFPIKYTLTEIEKKKFGWMNTVLKLPITINYKDFDFELGYNINFPRSVVSSEKLESTSYFNFSIGYIISL